MTIAEKDWFLSLPAETKLKLLGDMLKEGESGMALETAKILLDAPISKGGISSEEIDKVFNNNLKMEDHLRNIPTIFNILKSLLFFSQCIFVLITNILIKIVHWKNYIQLPLQALIFAKFHLTSQFQKTYLFNLIYNIILKIKTCYE